MKNLTTNDSKILFNLMPYGELKTLDLINKTGLNKTSFVFSVHRLKINGFVNVRIEEGKVGNPRIYSLTKTGRIIAKALQEIE